MTSPRPGPEPATDAAAALAALRERGAQSVDPVRFAFLEALARRTPAHQGDVQQALQQTLARALVAYGERCAQVPPPEVPPGAPHGAPAAPASPGPLGRLVQHIDSLAPAPRATESGAPPAALPGPTQRELKALVAARGTWTRLSAERQLNHSLAQVPDNPGPLNSHRLVLRSLQLMQSVSPAYLEHFIAQAEALLWLEQAAAADDATAPPPRRDAGGKAKKPGRGSTAAR